MEIGISFRRLEADGRALCAADEVRAWILWVNFLKKEVDPLPQVDPL
jgi:hypothetical protein